MKIHSSSLAYSPARLNSQQLTNSANNKQTNPLKAETSVTQNLPPKTNAALDPQKNINTVQKSADSTSPNLNTAGQNPANTATDKRTQNALNAYQQSFTQQPAQAQQNGLATGVDYYA